VAWESALSSSIEVAIAIAGFSGIIAVFGRKPGESWPVEDILQLQMLLTASAVAGLFSFLPFVLVETQIEDQLVWKAGSGLQILWLVTISIFRLRQVTIAGASAAVGMTKVLVPFFVITLILQIANVSIYASAWVYVLGVIFQLSVGFAAFVTLILGKVTNAK
jgi:hypothetical protein